MRKSLLALAVIGSFASVAHAQSSVTIYGIIDASVSYNSKVATGVGAATGNRAGIDSGAINGSRIGFKGSEDLGGGLKALFNLETASTSIPALPPKTASCSVAPRRWACLATSVQYCWAVRKTSSTIWLPTLRWPTSAA